MQSAFDTTKAQKPTKAQRKLFCIFVDILCFCGVFLSGCSIQQPYQQTRILLGTYITIKIADADKSAVQLKEAVNKAFAEIKKVEDLLSSFRQGNTVDKINNSGTNEVLLDEDTFYILEKAKYFYEISDSAFDITVLPLLELWGFHKKNYSLPSEEAIKETLRRVGSNKMMLNKEKKSLRFLKDGMKIDLGGIGKGYAVDRAVYILRKEGVKNALVAAAGDIYCIGRKSKSEKWKVGIRDPIRKNKIIQELELEDVAISTSGSYENYFEVGGKRYSHIINPKTGRPVENNLLSVTIIAKDNITADALATAVFVLGKEKGLEMVNRLSGIKAIIITDEQLRVNK